MIDFEEDIVEGNDSKPSTGGMNLENSLWVTKYRPRTLERFCLEPRLKTKFQAQIDANDIQSVSLVGGPGIGKTTLALILANSIKDADILFMSCASGDGKIESIQLKIIPFCQSASRGQKIIILDEFDSASSTQANSFQKSLRNVIESFPDCRWIATANYKSGILPPLFSRMPLVELNFSVTDMISNILYILEQENIKIASPAPKVRQLLGNLIKSCYPDMRMLIGNLQSSCINGELDVDKIVVENQELVKTTMAQFLSTMNSASTPLELRKTYNNEVLSFGQNGLLSELCSPYGLAKALFNHIVDSFNVPCEDLMALVDYLYRIDSCVDKETQLFGFLLKVKALGLNQ